MGRPSEFTEELGAEICAAISTSSDGLEKICAAHEHFPAPSTVYLWILRSEKFSESYARARADQAQLLADEIISIADTPQEGEVITETPDGVQIKRGDMLEHRKLRIESRKWVAAKLLPKKYGDKLQQEVSGPNGNAIPVSLEIDL